MNNFFLLLISIPFMLGCSQRAVSYDAEEETFPDSLLAAPVKDSDTFMIGDKRFELYPSSREEFDRFKTKALHTTEETRLRFNGAPFVKRSDETLIFQLRSGKKVSFVNNRDVDSRKFVVYVYMDNMNSINQWLAVESTHSPGYFFVDKTTADTVLQIGMPVVSPDNRYVLSYNSDFYSNTTFNGLELYEMKGGRPVRVGRKKCLYWAPEEIKWIDNETLLVKQIDHDIIRLKDTIIYKKMLLKE